MVKTKPVMSFLSKTFKLLITHNNEIQLVRLYEDLLRFNEIRVLEATLESYIIIVNY